MRDHAQVVIVGAGIVGCSAAYHLAQRGCTDVVVLEQGPLFKTGGSSSHAPGLMFQLNASKTVAELAMYSKQLYSQLELDGLPGFYQAGSLELALTADRWQELKRKEGHALSWGLHAELIGADDAGRMVPQMRTATLLGALYVPSDGIAKAVRVSEALAIQAQERGAEFYAHTPVTGIVSEHGRVQEVVTPHGRIRAENILLCAGIWGPAIGRMAGVPIPLTPVQHQYVITAPLPELAGESREIAQPIVRLQDKSMYFRQHADSYGIGSYRHEPLLVDVSQIPSHHDTEMPSVLTFTEADFAPARVHAEELFPCLRGVDLPSRINGMFSFTPDGQSLLGEWADLRGFWVAEAVWVTHAGGIGKVIADWIVDGTPGIDTHEIDVNRFHAHALSSRYVQVRGAQQYREVYDIIHPLQQIEQPRPLRVSPFHRRQEELGAVFFESAGWERPQWFTANERLLGIYDGPTRSGWAARHWSPICGAEHQATRDRVAMFDLTAFTKLEVRGPGALRFLQWIASNQMDQPLGKVTYTAMLNERGGIECDLTVTRLEEDRFMVVTGGSAGMHDLAWIRRHLPADGSVQLTNVTSSYCCIGLWGPRARDLVQQVSEHDVSNQAFPYFTAQQFFLGCIPVLAMRVSYAGELGWEIYASTEFGLALWDMLWQAGQSFGVLAAGGGAFDSLRLEKGYRLWGVDIQPEYTPYEAGLGFAVRLKKGDFLGRGALVHAKERGPSRVLGCLVFDDPEVVVMGKEPIFDGARVLGYVTSANYGYTVRRSIAYGYVPVERAQPGTRVEVQFFGRRHAATVTGEPLYDPRNERLTR
jgi:glycine cleavage system T protein